MSIAPELFRKAWGKFPTGVSIVITHTEDGAPWCTTANAVSSVSLEPPLVQLSLGKDGVTCANILRDLRFGINVLREGQDEMAAFFAREGVEIVGVASEPMQPEEFDKISSKGNADLAHDLGRRGFTEHPEAEALYIGGGSWLSQPVAEQLEKEFGKPAYCNQDAQLRHLLLRVGIWQPMEGHGKLLSLP